MAYGPKPTPPHERFWKHVTPGDPDECWTWQGTCANGYGHLWGGEDYPTQWALAHRISWELRHGVPVPEGLKILHHCDNPTCVNPAHLYAGTQADNARDRAARGRGRETRQRGVANPNVKLTEDQVRAIIAALSEIPRRSQASIAAEFGVKQAQVSRIMHRKAWGHLWLD